MALLYRLFTGVTCGTLVVTELYSLTNDGPSPTIGGVYSYGATYYSITENNGNTSNFFGESLGPVDTNTNYVSCPGITSRPFAYNPTQSTISGTYNIGTLCIGVTNQNYSSGIGGLNWWGGPNENEGYCIGTVVPAQNQSTPLGNIGNVKFWRTPIFTQDAFKTLASSVTGQSFASASAALTYLNANNYWASIIIPLYTFTSFTFTPVGATSTIGPTALQTQTAYSAQTFYPYFSNSSGIQQWTVPVDGSYLIECAGASGGNIYTGLLGGKAANISGTFTLTKGTILRLVVGQTGISLASGNGGGGGGGGSFVVPSGSTTPLIVAGGGGGAGYYSGTQLSGNSASLTTSGNLGGTVAYGGSAGSGTGAGGGGGLNSNGGTTTYGNPGSGYVNGAYGGNGYSSLGAGGFGGGAGMGFSAGGGAGGYTGGNGGNNAVAPPAAGGGGSYNAGASPSSSLMTTAGNGYITITKL